MSIIAYCAGVIDSDGTIGIKCNSYAARVVKDCRNASYSARICVRQVTTEALEILQATFGGSVRPAKTYAKRGRLMYSWEIRDQLAERALKRLMPHLRIKKAQAQNCLALRILIARSKRARMAKGRGHAGASHRPQDITDAMEIAFNNAKKLNRVGVQP
jgi:hypothetical protein